MTTFGCMARFRLTEYYKHTHNPFSKVFEGVSAHGQSRETFCKKFPLRPYNLPNVLLVDFRGWVA
jgi:hypothetical protein